MPFIRKFGHGGKEGWASIENVNSPVIREWLG